MKAIDWTKTNFPGFWYFSELFIYHLALYYSSVYPTITSNNNIINLIVRQM